MRDTVYGRNSQQCQAPYPPGTLGQALAGEKVRYYRQGWYCTWVRKKADCLDPGDDEVDHPPSTWWGGHADADAEETSEQQAQQLSDATRKLQCGYVQVWRCKWSEVTRSDVLAALAATSACGGCDAGPAAKCDVPADIYFARIPKVTYAECNLVGTDIQDCNQCLSNDEARDCACCGVREVVGRDLVRIRSRKDVPKAEEGSGSCAAATSKCTEGQCKVSAAKSPSLARILPF